MTLDPTFGTPGLGTPGMLAADVDRERAIDVLNAGFTEGRLTKAEHDDRVARAYAARTYGELGPLIVDLPAGPLGAPMRYPVAPYPPRQAVKPGVNAAAVAALTCGLGTFFTMGLTGVPAIVLGHSARRQVRETREQGDRMALAGIALGWAGVAMLVAFAAVLLAAALTVNNMQPAVGRPVPVKPGVLLPWQQGGPANPHPVKVGGGQIVN